MEKTNYAHQFPERPDFRAYLLSFKQGQVETIPNSAALETKIRRSASYLKKKGLGVWSLSSKGEKETITITRIS